MLVRQIGPAACRSYLIACERARRAVWVDPLLEDVERRLEELEAEGLTLDLVIDTHTHADHLSGGAAVAKQAGVPYALYEGTSNPTATERVKDGQVLEVGDVRLEVLHTPGHTPDSVTLRAENRLFTGDFLFLAQDGAGRLDLPGGDPGAHWESLRRLSAFDDEQVVFPGHDYNELTHSTLGVERTRNPRFQRITREEYVAWQRAVAAPTPEWMLGVIAANLGQAEPHIAHHTAAGAGADAGGDACASGASGAGGGACAAGPVQSMPMLFPQEVRRRLEGDGAPFLLDVREPWEYSGPMGRHAPGAVLIPLGQLPQRLDELPQDRERELHVICRSGARSASATAFLIASGYRRVFNVATGTDGWVRAGLPVES